MIRLRRPQVEKALDAKARSYLKRRSEAAQVPPRDVRIGTAWASFLGTKTRAQVAEALDAYTRAKCAYCEQVAAKDIEHFWPKTSYPDRMFSWDNFLALPLLSASMGRKEPLDLENLAVSHLKAEEPIKLVEYHTHRNEISTKSHSNTWIEKHEEVKYVVLEE